MALTTRHLVPADLARVWEWHTRDGALTRLTPPFLPMKPIRQAESLKDGVTEFSLPGGLTWVARHLPEDYEEQVRFADTCENAPLRQITEWTHTHTFISHGDQTEIVDHVDTRAPAGLITPAFAYRQRQLINDLAFLNRVAGLNTSALTIAVTGAGGTVGRKLCAQLRTAGHTVIELTRSNPGKGQRLWDPEDPAHDLLDGVDVLVHLAGEPIFGRFNDEHKAKIYSSRIGPTRRLAQLVGRVDSVKAMVSASAIGFYGADRGDELLTESSPRGDGFLADVVTEWEGATQAAVEAGKRVVTVRTGLVLAGDGGLLPLFRALVSTGLGGPLGDGQGWMSWISSDDLGDIYTTAVLDDSLSGPVNAVAPNPVRNAEFTSAVGTQLHRPTKLPVPSFGPAILLGQEGAKELALANQKVDAGVLSRRGHTFRYSLIDDCLAHELGKEQLMDSDQ
ncbi:TIGR01777 family oxidoreductase [Corynebacterium tapiri]|uniref:TIGR01777 family protein n=1 Tax=Corynebacterium tapiri TaxID=1448266 RepID=A0A5C4U3V8_9CORY|nr:TIGR01777 family oxidoreductase [Corynebacterium tapiri]TNL97781.1 TIGR01777 family protein [Corynebacterium tapiri]